MKKGKRQLIAIGLVALLVFVVGWRGVLERNDQFMEGAWRFHDTVTVDGASTLTGAVTMSSTLAVTGDTTLSGDLDVTNEFVHGKYDSDEIASHTGCATGADLDIDPADGDVLIFTGTTAVTLSLPSLSANLDGWMFTMINRAGTGNTISTQLADAMFRGGNLGLSTTGSFGYGGTTVTWVDSIGDTITFVGDYDSGTSPTWWIVSAVTQ
jgi:hypothetical protein